MPHTRSAKKRLRQNAKRRLANREAKKNIKVQVKKFMRALKDGNAEGIAQEFNKCISLWDKACARHVMHRNTASRRKAQLARLLKEKTAARSED